MEIKRDYYLQQLIDRQWNGMVKIITGIRRCGKSYLLRTLFRNYLLSQGIKDEQIIHIELDLTKNIRYRNPRVRLFTTPWTIAGQVPVHGISQARTLEWVATSFSRGSSQSRLSNPHLLLGRRILSHLSTFQSA